MRTYFLPYIFFLILPLSASWDPRGSGDQSMPLSLPGCRTKAESPSLAGFAPSPRETDLPGLRKAEATLTGLRFTGKGNWYRRANKAEPWHRKKVPSFFSPEAAIPLAWARVLCHCTSALLQFSSAATPPLSATNSRLPPPRLPVPNQRTSSDNQSHVKARKQAPIAARG